MLKITNHDDGTMTVALPAYSFEVSNKEGDEALVEQILDRVREELECHFDLGARFIIDGMSASTSLSKAAQLS